MAAKLMQSLTEDLVKVFSANDPLTIADGLFSKKLLTKEVYSRLRLEHRTDKDRSRDIVFHLNYQVDANPSDIYLIIEELLAKDLLSDRIQQILNLGVAALPPPPPSLSSQMYDYIQSLGLTCSQSRSQDEVHIDATSTQNRISASGSGQSQPLPGMDGKTALDRVASKGNGDVNGSGSSVVASISESEPELGQQLMELKDRGYRVTLQAPSKQSLNKQDLLPSSINEDMINVKREVVVLDADQSPEDRLTGREENISLMEGSSSTLAPSSLISTTGSYLETNNKTSLARTTNDVAVAGGGGMEKGGRMGISRNLYTGKKEGVGGASARTRLELAGETDTAISMARTPVRAVDFCCGFLSSRGSKRTKKSREEAVTSIGHHCSNISQVSAVNNSQVSVVTRASFTALSLGLDKEILPQTALSTRNHSSKTTPSCASSMADLIWTGEEEWSNGGDSEKGSNEDPWERGRWEYEPVLDGSGFIIARATPLLKISKSARQSFRADFDLKASNCVPLLTQPVEVELAELIITRHQDCWERVNTARHSGLKNFKRFRKRSSSRRHQSPVDLVTHVPVARHSLPDWELEVAPSSSELQRAEEGADSLEHSGRDSDGGVAIETQGSQDFDVFSLGARKWRRR